MSNTELYVSPYLTNRNNIIQLGAYRAHSGAIGYEPEGRMFESCRVHHSTLQFQLSAEARGGLHNWRYRDYAAPAGAVRCCLSPVTSK
jgi:hypothetical protein